MRCPHILAVAMAVCHAGAAFAQDRASPPDQTRAIIEFAIAASFHDEVIRSIQDQCPRYKAQMPFNDNVVDEARKLGTEIGTLLTRITEGAKPLARAHAAQIIANAGGCDADGFRKAIAATEEHQAMLALRAMQGRFR
jgi:hypothetical protein